jgi:two-component system response regulator YesN
MIAVVCGDEQQGSRMTNAVGSSVRMQQHYMEVRESIKEYCGGIVGTAMSNKLAVLVPCNEETMDYESRIALIDRTRELARQLKRRIGISFRIGIGKAGKIERMAESYNEALNALVMTTGSVAHADDLPIGCEYEEDYPINLEKRLFEEIEKGEADHALATARSFFKWLEEQGAGSMEEVRIKVLEFVLWAERLAYERGGMVYRFNSRQDYLATVMGAGSMEALKEWFLNKILEACRNIAGKREEKSNSIIETAQKYIRDNYSKNISLDDVSKEVNISPYYFSKVFKEGTGEGFVEYLTNIRIEKAKELLSTTEFSMREICSMCGYSDPNYFSRSFKKKIGISPTEYKVGKES